MAAALGPRPRMSPARLRALIAAALSGINDWQAALDSMLDYGALEVSELPDRRDRAEARNLQRRIRDAELALDSLGRYKGAQR